MIASNKYIQYILIIAFGRGMVIATSACFEESFILHDRHFFDDIFGLLTF
jgi:hypothetical protein